MDIEHSFFDFLDCVNVASKDNGKTFTDTTRLDNIEKELRDANSLWKICGTGPLFRLYGGQQSAPSDGCVVISSHADSTFENHIYSLLKESKELQGTFDNSITNAVLLQLMLQDLLPRDVLVAFTGDEENESEGAASVIKYLENIKAKPSCVMVLDVTDNSYYDFPFTIENWFPNGSHGLPKSEGLFLKFLLEPFQHKVPTVHHNSAWPDESWRYEEEGVHVFSLCIPTSPPIGCNNDHDWMHNENGVRIRLDSIRGYSQAILTLATILK